MSGPERKEGGENGGRAPQKREPQPDRDQLEGKLRWVKDGDMMRDWKNLLCNWDNRRESSILG